MGEQIIGIKGVVISCLPELIIRVKGGKITAIAEEEVAIGEEVWVYNVENTYQVEKMNEDELPSIEREEDPIPPEVDYEDLFFANWFEE